MNPEKKLHPTAARLALMGYVLCRWWGVDYGRACGSMRIRRLHEDFELQLEQSYANPKDKWRILPGGFRGDYEQIPWSEMTDEDWRNIPKKVLEEFLEKS